MSQEQMQYVAQQMQMLEQRIAELSQRESALANAMREAQAASTAVSSIEESETLIPIGMGVFVKSSVSARNNLVLNIGAGVTIEKDKEYTLNYLEERIKEIEIALNDTSAKRQEAIAHLEQSKAEVNKLLQQKPA